MIALDTKCAEYGNNIANISDNNETIINKSLGVLQEDGVYAFFLYLESRGNKEKKVTSEIKKHTWGLIKNIGMVSGDFSFDGIREKVTKNLDHLLFTKNMLERTLVYARYHAKALGKPIASNVGSR